MALLHASYSEVRSKMRPGDVIAFGGKSHFSQLIKFATRSAVSHVGVVLQSKMLIGNDVQGGYFNQIIESATINGFAGVSINRMSFRMEYDGEIWWMPLAEKVRKKLDFNKFYNFLLHQNRKKYDTSQVAFAGLDFTDKIPLIGSLTHNEEDFSKFFCSELVAAGLEAGGVIDSINSSEVTPIDMCNFKLYGNDYYQIKGDEKEIRGYNKLDPKHFEY
jgi:hypothetical protein